MSDNSGLIVEDLHVRYGPSQVLFGVSLAVPAGRALAVLGTNGAGKSTLGRAVCGLVPTYAGRIRFNGTDITKWPAHRIRRAGLAYIPEGRGIFPGLSVLDNLLLSTRQLGGRSAQRDAMDRAREMFPFLKTREAQRAGSLSGGEQQMLALVRALVVKPLIVIADEMSLGLAPLMVEQVFDGLTKARAEGITIVLIEQYIHRALAFTDDSVILSRGSVTWTGPSREAGQEILNRYLGTSAQTVS